MYKQIKASIKPLIKDPELYKRVKAEIKKVLAGKKQKLEKSMTPQEMRQELCDTADDHYEGSELEKYITKITNMSDDKVIKEYKKTFPLYEEIQSETKVEKVVSQSSKDVTEAYACELLSFAMAQILNDDLDIPMDFEELLEAYDIEVFDDYGETTKKAEKFLKQEKEIRENGKRMAYKLLDKVTEKLWKPSR